MKRRRKPHEHWHKQYFVISVDMFRVDVGVCMNMSEAEINRRVSYKCSLPKTLPSFRDELSGWDSDSVPHGSTDGCMLKLGGGFVVLLTSRKGCFRDMVALVTHEMVHVAQYLLRDRRIPLSIDTEEVHAYLTEHLVRETLRRLYS